MNSSITGPILAACLLACGGCLAAGSTTAATLPTGQATTPRATLRPFASEREFERLLQRWHRQTRPQRERARIAHAIPAPPPAPVAAAAAPAPAAADAITNVQTAGVDEGGIVKRHGDHLVILRRGRLFTVRIGDDTLRPVAMIDAFAPGIAPGHSWYDEMLVSGDTVMVIGYSYARGGTEIGLFDIDPDGSLSYRDTWHLRSNDYYSSRNYASRLAGNRLVFYTPMPLDLSSPSAEGSLPALRRWSHGAANPGFQRILPASRIYRTTDELDPTRGITLHTVTICTPGSSPMQCESSAVLGPPGRVFYMSADSVFVWTTRPARDPGSPNTAGIFRIPLDGSAPSALRASGSPIDQLSFLQDASGYLNVLISASGRGEGMWNAEGGHTELALLRVHLGEFGDGSTAVPAAAYRPLPGSRGYSLHNRYVGDWLIYGSAPSRWHRGPDTGQHPPAHAVRYASGSSPVAVLEPGHAVERIEAIGRDAVLIGNAGSNLHFTSVELGLRAVPGDSHVMPDAAQGERRSHGFFYRNDGDRRGLIGLPVVGSTADRGHGSASVVYLRNRGLRLAPAGQLDARAPGSLNDGCRVSCVDWYGDARPIFIDGRVFALLGYELVEGRLEGGTVRERRRTSFAPAVRIAR